MLFDSIHNKENYKDFPQLFSILDYLSSITLAHFPLESVTLEAEKIFANPVTFTSKPEEDCAYEAHQKFIDIHYIVSGVEGIATADVKTLTETVPFDETKDIGFYSGIEEGRYYLYPGYFMVCWPSDAHKVGMMKDLPGEIKKVVIKLKVGL